MWWAHLERAREKVAAFALEAEDFGGVKRSRRLTSVFCCSREACFVKCFTLQKRSKERTRFPALKTELLTPCIDVTVHCRLKTCTKPCTCCECNAIVFVRHCTTRRQIALIEKEQKIYRGCISEASKRINSVSDTRRGPCADGCEAQLQWLKRCGVKIFIMAYAPWHALRK